MYIATYLYTYLQMYIFVIILYAHMYVAVMIVDFTIAKLLENDGVLLTLHLSVQIPYIL